MGNLTASLTVKLIDDVSKPARTVAQALEQAGKQAQTIAKAMAGSGATDRFAASLGKLKLSAKDIEAVSAAWKSYSASAKLAGTASSWTREQAAGVRRWESQTISALRAVEREQAKFERASRQRGGAVGGHGDMSGRQMAAAIAGGYIAHKTAEFGKDSLETYREYDRERRYAQVVMGLNDKQMEPLIGQAIHGSAVSKYNDIQWLEGQRDLASRGYGIEQVRAFAPVAALIGQAFDVSLPEGVKALEGAMLGFRKDTSTFEKALAASKRTADLEVKTSKISGMSYEDIVAAYKYGAAPAQMGHLSEESLLAFAAISKKANMGGDESGVAYRALVKNLLSPTDGAKVAMMAAGIDYSKYQKGPREGMNMPGFYSEVSRKYGVRLSGGAKAALAKIMSDPETLMDPDAFTPAVTDALKGQLKGKDAKSLKSIAGLAARYRDASMSGVDTEGLQRAIMAAIAKNPALANAIFGSKQGGRISAALGDEKLYDHTIDQLKNHSEGFAQKVSDARMDGFDGAVSRFEGATKALQTALGRAFDNEGKGGFLTGVANTAASFTQSLAEASPSLQRLGATAGLAAASFAGFKSFEVLMGGFGLKGAATALTGAAEALMVSAGKLSVAGAENALAGGGASGGKGILGKLGAVAKGAVVVGTAIEATQAVNDYLHENGFTPTANDGKRPVFHSLPKPPPGMKRPGSLWDDLSAAGEWIKKSLVGEAHADELPRRREPASPYGDLSGARALAHGGSPYGDLFGIQVKAEEAKAALETVNGVAVSPVVDGASLDAAIAKANQLAAVLRSLSGLASGAGAAVAGIKAPSLGTLTRGSFTPSGDPGR